MTTRPEQRLLAVFAHPDDETIGAGSLLALAAQAGADVSVVTCTRGERGEVVPTDLATLRDDPEGLARQRETELSGALAELGVHRHLYLDQVPGLDGQRPARFRDSGMRWVRPGLAGPAQDAGPDAFTAVDVETAALLLAVVLRHLRPTAVLTEEPGGGYGHPDHVHAHRVTMRAVEIAAEGPASGAAPLAGLAPWQVPTVLWVAQEETHLRAAFAELAATLAHHAPEHDPHGTVLTVPEPPAELPGIAVPASEVVASFDIRPVAQRVIAALRRHRSQVQAVAAIDGHRLVGRLALSNATFLPLLDRAYVRPAPGSDATDLVAALSTTTTPAQQSRVALPDAESAHAGSLHAEPSYAEPSHAEPSYAGPSYAGPSYAESSYAEPAHAEPPAADAVPTTPPRPRGVLGRLVTRGGAAGVIVSLTAGLVMGMLGTVVHRYFLGEVPVGIALGLLGVLAAAVAARAIAGGGGLLLAALAAVGITQAMAFLRPGGDVLVTNELISYAWLFGTPLACVAAALLPARWFADRRQGRQT